MAASLLRRLAHDRDGAVAIMLALSLPLLVGMMSLGVETGLWYAEKRDLQNAADAAALSGAFELAAGRTTTVKAAATSDATRNGFSAAEGIPATVNAPPTSGKYVGDTSAVEVILSRDQTLLLSTLFLGSTRVTARAVARSGGPGDYCVLALDPNMGGAVDVTGSASISLADCGVAANSKSAQALQVSGSGTLTTKYIQTVGGYDVSGSGKLSAGATITDASPITDPYAGLSVPSYGGCTASGFNSKKTETIDPGVYCGGMDFNAKANVTLNPGTYIVKGGSIKINGQAVVKGAGVTLILTGSGGDIARIDINGGATVDLSAPTTGDFAGVAMYQDRNAGDGDNKFNGGATMQIDGALYFPSQELDFSGNNSSATDACVRLIAKQIKFTGNSDLGNKCTGSGVASGSGGRPVLVE